MKLEMQEQLRAENEELKLRKKKDEEWHKANDQRVGLECRQALTFPR